MSASSLLLPATELPPAAVQVRGEVRSFLEEELDQGSFTPRCDAWLAGHSPAFSRKLGERGWLGMTWPRRYGGAERSALERFVVIEELLAAGAPVAAHWISDRQVGPAILRYGTEQQRQTLLPSVTKGECFFAIGMSEPDSGSDLASVRTRAVRVDGAWRLTGTKIWTSHAHSSDYVVVLGRTADTDPSDRHAGLSQFIVDLHIPGVIVNPVRLLDGEHHFNEVVFDGVIVPDQMVLGQIGEGWKQVTAELAFERSGPERFLSTFPLLRALAAPVRAEGRRAEAVAGRLVAELVTLREMSLRVAASLERGEVPDVPAAVIKDLGTRFEGEVIDVTRTLVGNIPATEATDELSRLLAQAVLHAPGFTLRGGTNEILRGIVARELGLR